MHNWSTDQGARGKAVKEDLQQLLDPGIIQRQLRRRRGVQIGVHHAQQQPGSEATGNHLDYVIAGIGLNIAVDFSSQPELAHTAISLQTALGRPVDSSALLVALLSWVETHVLAMEQGISPLAAWKERLVTLGRPIEARSPDGRVLFGVALDVLQDGSLLLRLDDGSEQIVRAADVTLRGSNNEP